MKRLRDFLRLGAVGGSEQVVTGNRRPLGYQPLTVGATAVNLVLPAVPANSGLTCNYAIIQNQDAAIYIRWRDDGVAPTSTTGMRLPPGAELDYAGDLAKIQLIAESSSVTANVSVYA